MPKLACNRQSFRPVKDGPPHLRTFYAWLFKAIRLEDLCYNGKFAIMTRDLAMMFPMIEMANGHFNYISDALYIYNENNPISEHRIRFEFQTNLSSYFRKLPPYMPIDRKVAKKHHAFSKIN